MRLFFAAIIASTLTNSGCSQPSEYEKFIDSFTEQTNNGILNFGQIVQNSNQMSKQEATKFVYDGDTSKLHCRQLIVNMETEKVEGVSTELYLPDKCLRVEIDGGYLIGYSFYQCQDPNQLLEVRLKLKTLDKNYQVVDTLTVYRGTDYDWMVTGLTNPKQRKIFLVGNLKNNKTNDAVIYTITEEMRLKKSHEKSQVKTSDNIEKVLDGLGWKEIFFGE